MSFMAEVIRENLDTEASATLSAIEPDYSEGKADFAFGLMPQHPHDPNYMRGWFDELQNTVKYEDGRTVYPESHYRVNCTTDHNAIFTNVQIAESAQKGWVDDF